MQPRPALRADWTERITKDEWPSRGQGAREGNRDMHTRWRPKAMELGGLCYETCAGAMRVVDDL